ncbi:hypothetical protein M6B38_280380 [Iris pallida]|uniref:Uncharacterized protein n=1 Tax=Iris pallida TaxID=29817 RepID=A0AAX6I1L1_IRIPA|nr:hypothetical protein M6B38_280380 [Iris pallida]
MPRQSSHRWSVPLAGSRTGGRLCCRSGRTRLDEAAKIRSSVVQQLPVRSVKSTVAVAFGNSGRLRDGY